MKSRKKELKSGKYEFFWVKMRYGSRRWDRVIRFHEGTLPYNHFYILGYNKKRGKTLRL